MLLNYLERVVDKRRRQGCRYPLKYVLLFCILAILCGASSYRDINRYIKGHLPKLKKLFGLHWKQPPSKSMLRETLCHADRDELEQAFRGYSADLSDQKTGAKRSIAIDGKVLKGSFDHLKEHKALHLLSVFCTENQLILGHLDIPDKTNEIPTAQALIKELGLPEGSVYTLDAMHCQKKPLRRLRKRREN